MLHLASRTVLLALLCTLAVACGNDASPGGDDDEGDGGAEPDNSNAGRGGHAGSTGRFDIDAGFDDGGLGDGGLVGSDAGTGDDDAGADDAGTVSCTNPVDCADDDACTQDSCRNNVCVNAPIDPDDDDACTTDTCDPDTGVHNDAVTVADSDPCTTDSCDPATGVAHVVCPSGVCDGNACLDLVTTSFSDAPALVIPTGPSAVSDTIVVSGAGTSLWDLNVRTSITHLYATELDVTLRSPAGTIVTLTSDNGFTTSGDSANVFNGTVWDDSANPAGAVPYTSNAGMVTDHPYVSGATATPLTPEEALGAFIGENPNGTWTLTIADDTSGDGGGLAGWGLDVTTISAAPLVAIETFMQSTPQVITDRTTITSTIVVPANASGGRLCTLTVSTNISHTYNDDLAITLASPGGKLVSLSTYNGDLNDNVFAGTVWDDNANPAGQIPYDTNDGLVTDHLYVNATLASPLAPEEPLSALIGETVAGTWTLTVSDDGDMDTGMLHGWSLNLGRCLR